MEVADRGAAVAVALAALAAYLPTLCPTIPPGDSGELIACAATLGVPHPPGYPVYTFLGWIWIHVLPLGSVAWRMNLFSAAAMAGAAGVVFLGGRALGAGRVAAAGAALAFALARDPWRAAVGAEVFALHALLTAAILLAALRWPGSGRPPYVAALLLGFAGAHHLTAVLLVPALAGWAWAHRGGPPLRPRTCLGLVAAGLSAYLLLLPLGARASALSWGETSNLAGLTDHVFRTAYGTGALGSAEGGGLAGGPLAEGRGFRWLGFYLGSGLGGLWLAAPAAAAGAVVALRGPAGPARRGAILLLATWALAGPLFVFLGANFDPADSLRRSVVARFHVMPAVPLALLAAQGLEEAGRRFGAPAAVAAAAAAALASAVPAAPAASLRGVTAVEAFGRNLLASAPERALVLVSGDLPTNACEVLQRVEGVRPDVLVVNQEKLQYPWMRERLRDAGADFVLPGKRYDGREVTNLRILEENLPRRRVLFFGFATDVRRIPDESYKARYRVLPRGLLFEAVASERPVDLEAVARENERLLESFDWSWVGRAEDAYFLREAADQHVGALVKIGHLFQQGAAGDRTGPRLPAAAERVYRRGVALFPDAPDLRLNLGLLLRDDLGKPDEAKEHFRRYLELRPDDPRRAEIEAMGR
ncbi:MAG: DUF2723 domain-containing protein [Planctomycetales bacterium]|nr:DUF2723 domain-containing protein [Planctomycetales bacterium]